MIQQGTLYDTEPQLADIVVISFTVVKLYGFPQLGSSNEYFV